MAKTAARRSARAAPKQITLRPALLAAGLGLFWFVEFQDAGGVEGDMAMWNYLAMVGTRLLADFVGAWVLVSGLLLAVALLRFGLTYLRALWLQGNG